MMSLSDQDKRDLLGWISGLGDVSSNARAQQLLKSSAESVEYIVQMKTIQASFQPLPEQDTPSALSDLELTQITRSVVKRADRIRDTRAVGRLRYTRWAIALAACIALLILPSAWILSLRQPVLGDVTFFELNSKLQANRGSETGPPVLEGSTVKTNDKLAIISFRNGQRLTLDAKTTLQVNQADRVELHEGAVLAEIPASLEIKLSGATLRLDSGKANIEMMSEGFSCDLSSGHASVRIKNRDHKILPGQRGVWNSSDESMSILQLDSPRPSRMEAATQPSQ